MDEIKIDCFEGYTGAKYLMHFMDEIIQIVSECKILQVSSESNHAKEQAKISAYNERAIHTYQKCGYRLSGQTMYSMKRGERENDSDQV